MRKMFFLPYLSAIGGTKTQAIASPKKNNIPNELIVKFEAQYSSYFLIRLSRVS